MVFFHSYVSLPEGITTIFLWFSYDFPIKPEKWIQRPAGDVILWRSREDAEPLQCWALWRRARLPRHRGDRTSVDAAWGFWVVQRDGFFVGGKKEGWFDFNGFYIGFDTQTIKKKDPSVCP